jgi:tRNA-specific 2-thiouridylase
MKSPSQKSCVAVAMSGGVDSSVAAALLLEQGFDVFGVTMRLPQPEELQAKAPISNNAEPSYIHDAQKAAEILGISHIVIDIRKEFHEQIIRYFCQEYARGRTPNPCVLCNPRIKFGRLFDYAHELGADRLATGHYVKLQYDRPSHRYLLKTADNLAKDQSYFLYRLSQTQLARTLFPLAGFTKDMIRQKAGELGLDHVAEKSESQENCFIADQSYQDFLQDYLPASAKSSGPIVDTEGHVLGEHQGIHRYTIGQRRGLGVALGSPRYVIAIHPETNTVVVGEDHELFTREFLVNDLRFIALEKLSGPLDCLVKIRYRHAATPATIYPGDESDTIKVVLQTPQRAVTPGQSAVFYDQDCVLGGGIIALRPRESGDLNEC